MTLHSPNAPPATGTASVTAALILAAGRGERMRPLTDHTPKPLLVVRGKALVDWHVEALARGGFDRLVVNTAWLGEQIAPHFEKFSQQRAGSGKAQPLSMAYSHEGQDFGGALETAGGIARALPVLGDVFWVLAGDVYAPDFVFSEAAVARFKASGKLAHLWLVANPPHNAQGDFGLSADGLALNVPAASGLPRWTFSTIGLYRRDLFCGGFGGIPAGNPGGLKAALAPLLRQAMDNQCISAEVYPGAWTDVGTPARFSQLNQ